MIFALKSAKKSVISADTPPKKGKKGRFFEKTRAVLPDFGAYPPIVIFEAQKRPENDPISEHIPPILVIF